MDFPECPASMRNSLGTGRVDETNGVATEATMGAVGRLAATLWTFRQNVVAATAHRTSTRLTQLLRIHDLLGSEAGTWFSGTSSAGERIGGGTVSIVSGMAFT